MDTYSHPEDRKVRVAVEASDFTAEGLVHLPGIRLSDVMNEKNPFLILVNAVVLHKRLGSAEQPPTEYETLFIRKGEIRYVVPVDEPPKSRLS
jgi:hypothetical protein